LSEIISKNDNNDYFVEYYFNMINKLLINFVNNSSENYECSILSKIINILLDYIHNKIILNDNNEIKKKFNIPKNIDEIMKELIKINIDEYFPEKNHRNVEDLFIRDNTRKEMPNKIAFIIDFIFRYFDICLLLLYNENQAKFVDYMINSENNLFKYYIDYKILTLEKFREKNNYKESIAFIYYIIKILLSKSNEIYEINKSINCDMTINNIYEYKLSNNSDLFDITFKNLKTFNNKIIIFCFNDKLNKDYFQDIIDFNNPNLYDNLFKLRVNNIIYLIPKMHVNTYLFSVENEKKSTNIEGNDNLINLTKYEEIPKYTWNIGYDENKYLLLSEEDNNIYSFIEHKNYSESIKIELSKDKKIEVINNKNNKIIFES